MVDLKDFTIIDSSYHNYKFKRKITKALYIAQFKGKVMQIVKVLINDRLRVSKVS